MAEKGSLLKATPEIRESLDKLGDQENFTNCAQIILKYIHSSLQNFSSSLVKNGIKEDQDNFSEDVKYVIKRLVFGCASKRKFYRHGFYATLQTILQLHPELIHFTYVTADKFYKEEDSNSVTDSVVGNILVFGAIVKSGYLFNNVELARNILEQLNKLRTKSFSVDPIVGQFIVHLLAGEYSNFIDLVWEVFEEDLSKSIDSLEPSLFWIRFYLCRKINFSQLKNVPHILKEETLGKESYSLIYNLFKKMFSANIDISYMLQDYFLSLTMYEGGNNNLVAFFSEVVPPDLKNPTPQKISFNFMIVRLLIPYLCEVEQLKSLFCSAVVQQLLSAASFKGEVAINSARKLVDATLQKIIAHKDKDDLVQITILKQLINSPGTVRFDKVTGTKLFQESYEHLRESTIKDLCNELISIIENDKYEVSTGVTGLCLFSGEVISAAHWISRLLSHPNIIGSNHAKWRAAQIFSLLKNVFFRKHPQKEMQTLKETFVRALEQRTKKLEDQITVLERIVEKTDGILMKRKGYHNPLSQESLECWKKVFTIMKNLKNKEETNLQKDLMIFRLLYAEMNLHLFINPKIAQEIISELDHCYKKAVESKSKKRSKNVTNEPEWVEVVVDLLLSLLSKGDHYWRKIVTSVFRTICHSMDSASVSLITDIIDPNKKEDLLINEDDKDEEDDNDSEEDDDENEEEEDENEEDDDSEEDNEETEELSVKEIREGNLMKLREEMQKLVGLPEEEVDMDSAPMEELNNLDKKLGALMKSYQTLKNSTKKKAKTKLAKDETSLMHFRTRVCDLLECLVQEAPSFEHLVNIMHPLLLAIKLHSNDSLQQQLCTRLRSILADLVKVKKFSSDSATTPQDVADEIKPLFDLSNKLPSSMNKEVGLCCTFLVRCCINLANEEHPESASVVIDSFAEQLELFFSKKDWDISEIAFTGTLTLDTGLLLPVLKILVKYSFDSATRFFRKQQALDMLKIMVFNHRSLKKMSFKSVKNVFKKIFASIVEFFDSIKDAQKIKIIQMIAVIDLLKTMKAFNKHNPEYDKAFSWAEINESIGQFYKRVPISHSKSLKKAFNALSEVLRIKLERHKEINRILKKTENKDKNTKKKEKLINGRIEGKKNKKKIGGDEKETKKRKNKSMEESKNKKIKDNDESKNLDEDNLVIDMDKSFKDDLDQEDNPKERKRLKKEKKKELKRKKLENEGISEEKLQRIKAKRLDKKLKKIKKFKEKKQSNAKIHDLKYIGLGATVVDL